MRLIFQLLWMPALDVRHRHVKLWKWVLPAMMANTAIATAGDVPAMAEAFKKAIEAGRSAYLSGLGRILDKGASASSPLTGFLHE